MNAFWIQVHALYSLAHGICSGFRNRKPSREYIYRNTYSKFWDRIFLITHRPNRTETQVGSIIWHWNKTRQWLYFEHYLKFIREWAVTLCSSFWVVGNMRQSGDWFCNTRICIPKRLVRIAIQSVKEIVKDVSTYNYCFTIIKIYPTLLTEVNASIGRQSLSDTPSQESILRLPFRTSASWLLRVCLVVLTERSQTWNLTMDGFKGISVKRKTNSIVVEGLLNFCTLTSTNIAETFT